MSFVALVLFVIYTRTDNRWNEWSGWSYNWREYKIRCYQRLKDVIFDFLDKWTYVLQIKDSGGEFIIFISPNQILQMSALLSYTALLEGSPSVRLPARQRRLSPPGRPINVNSFSSTYLGHAHTHRTVTGRRLCSEQCVQQAIRRLISDDLDFFRFEGYLHSPVCKFFRKPLVVLKLHSYRF